MFKKRSKRKGEPQEKVLDVNASMQGTMTFKDPVNLQINGSFEGTLDTKGNLTIGRTARVKANITGENVVIAGKVEGEIVASRELKIVSPAEMRGNIKTPSLTIEKGSIFQGKCEMASSGEGEYQPGAEGMNTEEVARYLEVDRKTVDEWASRGEIPAIRDKSGWRFDKEKIDEWVTSGRVR